MKMKEHIEFLKMLRIPYKEATIRAFWHILNEHKDEIDIEDLIKATCVYQRPARPRRDFSYRPRRDRRPRRGYREDRDRY